MYGENSIDKNVGLDKPRYTVKLPLYLPIAEETLNGWKMLGEVGVM